MPDINEIEQRLGINYSAATIMPVLHPYLDHHDTRLFIKREDLIHPVISGNKWRKLKYILKHALDGGYHHLISMGGACSNHLHALAWIGKELDLKTTGLIRGEAPEAENNTLRDLRAWGMQLIHVSRTEFRTLRTIKEADAEPAKRYKGYWIPEGGAHPRALTGCAEMIDAIDILFDTIAIACGTGTTLAGIARVLPPQKKALGFAVLNAASALEKEVTYLLSHQGQTNNWSINPDYHFGGFAKTDKPLLSFVENFRETTGIPIEPVYTGKLMYGLFDLIRKKKFDPGQQILAIHTGGLQGDRK